MANLNIYIGSHGTVAAPTIRRIEFSDLCEALANGARDFYAMPSHLAFLALIYPLCGVVRPLSRMHCNCSSRCPRVLR